MGCRCERVGWRGVGKASLNLIERLQNFQLSGQVGVGVWGKGLIESA